MNYKAKTRKALEMLYEGLCTVFVRDKITNPNTKRTEFVEIEAITDQPCRLSYKPIRSADQGDDVSSVSQVIKLFLAPEVIIPPGSKIVVTQHDVTQAYQQSGVPAVYTNHQEIVLDLFEKWA